MKPFAMLAPLALVALAGCGENAAQQQAAAEAKKTAAEAAETKRVEEGLALNVRCYAAIKWQQRLLDSPLPRQLVGGAQPYLDHYRNLIGTQLGDRVIPAAPPKPELSKAGLDAYLDWAVKDQIDTNFKPGGDAARTTFTGCVQAGADFGAGPLARLSPAERLGKVQQLRGVLDATN